MTNNLASDLFLPLVILLISTLAGCIVALWKENSSLRKDYMSGLDDAIENLSREVAALGDKFVCKADHCETHKILNEQILQLQQKAHNSPCTR